MLTTCVWLMDQSLLWYDSSWSLAHSFTLLFCHFWHVLFILRALHWVFIILHTHHGPFSMLFYFCLLFFVVIFSLVYGVVLCCSILSFPLRWTFKAFSRFWLYEFMFSWLLLLKHLQLNGSERKMWNVNESDDATVMMLTERQARRRKITTSDDDDDNNK